MYQDEASTLSDQPEYDVLLVNVLLTIDIQLGISKLVLLSYQHACRVIAQYSPTAEQV